MDTIPVMLLIYMENQRADTQQETHRINLSLFVFLFSPEIAVKNRSVRLTSEAHTVFHLPVTY